MPIFGIVCVWRLVSNIKCWLKECSAAALKGCSERYRNVIDAATALVDVDHVIASLVPE